MTGDYKSHGAKVIEPCFESSIQQCGISESEIPLQHVFSPTWLGTITCFYSAEYRSLGLETVKYLRLLPRFAKLWQLEYRSRLGL